MATDAQIIAAWAKPGATGNQITRDLNASNLRVRRLKPSGSKAMDTAKQIMRESGLLNKPIRTMPLPDVVKGEMITLPIQAINEMRHAYERGEDWEEPVEKLWQREEQRGAIAIRKAKEVAAFKFDAPGKNVMIAIISDMHIAPGTPVDFRKMRQDAELIRDTPGLYCVLAGDQVDNHIKHRNAILAARSQPEDQYKLFEYYLGIIGPKCLVVTSGNHDDWTNHFAGIDMLGRIVRDKRVFYSPDEAWIDINVGSQKYVLAVRHQYRFGSQFNQTHTVKQWLRLGPRDFDVGVIGHHHEAALEQTIWRDRFRWVARPGSYQITSAYSRQLGFNHAIPTCPTFLFHGDSHDITAWKSVEAMARSRAALKGMEAA